MDQPLRIAYFISAHGFGHAARACAVMEAMHQSHAAVRFELFTNAPQWFFEDSLTAAFEYHCLRTDIGMVQLSPFRTDTRATLRDLKGFLPFDRDLTATTAQHIRDTACRFVLCDIAPMGIAVALQAEIPSVLIENFTWDWIYREYRAETELFNTYIDYLGAFFQKATYHVQTEPVCNPTNADLRTGPAARKTREAADAVRRRLGIGSGTKMVMLTFGGIPETGDYMAAAQKVRGVHFVIPGKFHCKRTRGNTTLLPYRSEFYHPDLINAADAVIGKAGYSTIAEVFHANKPYGYISRPDFRESGVLTRFIDAHLAGLPISEAQLYDGSWTAKIPVLLEMPLEAKPLLNGADAIAAFVLNMVT